ALLLGTAGYGLPWALVALGRWGQARLTNLGELAAGIGVLQALPVLVGIMTLSTVGDRLWLAGAVGLMSATWAVLSAAQRREEMALAAGALFNLAASLVAWHFYRTEDIWEWWPTLVLVNVSASAVVALLWQALRKVAPE